jgi:hypothetical protein
MWVNAVQKEINKKVNKIFNELIMVKFKFIKKIWCDNDKHIL